MLTFKEKVCKSIKCIESNLEFKMAKKLYIKGRDIGIIILNIWVKILLVIKY